MNRLKQGFIILVAGLFLSVVLIGGSQAIVTGDNPKGSKSSKSDERGITLKHPFSKTGKRDIGGPKKPVKKGLPDTSERSTDPMKGLNLHKSHNK